MFAHVRSTVAFLLTIWAMQYPGVACAQLSPDRPFFVNWTKVTEQESGPPLWAVHFADSRTGWAVGLGGTILATLDAGTKWAQQGTHDIYFRAVDFTDLRTGWAVGNGGKIVATRDGGANWKEQRSGTSENLQSVHFVDAKNGWVVGLNGTIAATHDGGEKWELQRSGTRAYLSTVHFSDANNGWTVGDAGTIITTRNGGVTWERQFSGTNKNLVGILLPTRTPAGWWAMVELS